MNRVALLLTLAAATALGCGGAPAPRPPVVFVSIDTLAARHLSLHGYDRETAPNLSAFASEAILVERAQVNAPWTVPSYLSQFTGLYPGAHAQGEANPDAHDERPAWERHRLGPERETLATIFSAAGYDTAGFWENPWLGVDAFGFERGFDVWEGPQEGVRSGLAGRIARANAWLTERNPERPWFLFLQSTEPHAPYEPPPKWRDAFLPASPGERLPVAGEEGHAFGAIPRAVARGAADGELPAELDAGPLVAAYDAEILAMDAAFGALIEGLRRRGVLERAVVVFGADHGESMVQHDFLFGHGVLYEENLHVPLLVRLPGAERGGKRVAAQTQMVDLMPTLLELADLRRPEEQHGRSLVPLLFGAPDEGAALYASGGVQHQESLVEGTFKLIESRPWSAPASALASHPALDATARAELLGAAPARRVELVRYRLGSPRVELYDLAADPDELQDLADAAAQAARVEAMRERLRRERGRAEAARVEAAAVGGGASQAELRELERLGYAGGGRK